jgi:hypothetical protein
VIKALVVALLLPAAAHAETTVRTSFGIGLGDHEHPDNSGFSGGLDADVELRYGLFVVGGTAGLNGYSKPINATTFAARAGIDVPLGTSLKQSTGRRVRYDLIGALEYGVHRYSSNGEHTDFLGPTETFVGEQASIEFVGARLGTSMTIRRRDWKAGVIIKLEMIGRRDFDRSNIEFDKTSCGGFLRSENDCSSSHGMKNVGGTELGARVSFGIAFGD